MRVRGADASIKPGASAPGSPQEKRQSLRRSLSEKVVSLCLCGEITPENTHHRGTEIAQKHGDQFLRQTPKRAAAGIIWTNVERNSYRPLRGLKQNAWRGPLRSSFVVVLTSVNQAITQCLGDGFGLGMDLEFLVDVAHMERDGVDADI